MHTPPSRLSMSPEEFRAHAHAVVDWIADYRARVAKLPLQSRVVPGELLRALPESPNSPRASKPCSPTSTRS